MTARYEPALEWARETCDQALKTANWAVLKYFPNEMPLDYQASAALPISHP